MVRVSHPHLSADDFDALLGVIGRQHELIEGEVVVMVPDGVAAARAAATVARAIEAWVDSPSGSGEVLVDCFVRLDDGNLVGPDIAWYSQHPEEMSGVVRSRVPELVVEILSPSTRENDLGAKLRVYARSGVEELWLVDPEAGTAMTARLADGQSTPQPVEVLTSPLLPGFSLDVPPTGGRPSARNPH